MQPKRARTHSKPSGGVLTAVLLSLATCLPPVRSQTAPPPDKEVIELSPFEVSTSSEVGYLATQTLSGTRLRAELGDVAASIDVLTEEFLRDVGATNLNDALDYVGNVSTWGKSGGISEVENSVWFSNPYTARGFLTAATTTDFFDAPKSPLDFYNQNSFTVARGPYAILFGIGSPGGIVNTSRKRPLWGRELTQFQFRTDNYGSVRSTLDVSREIIERKLAVRAALLYDDRKEFLEPAGYLRRGAYAAVTYRPLKATSLTFTAEKGEEDRIFRYTTTQYDGITQWINAGRPVFGGIPGNPVINESLGTGLDREARIAVQIAGQPEVPILNWQNMARTERFEIAGHFDLNSVRTKGFTEQTALWDYDEIQLTGDSRQRDLDWDDYTLFLTQELFVPELQLELAYNHTFTEYLLAHSFGQFYLQMDANQKLPNGSPNPNFGIPYVESERSEIVTERNTDDKARATLSYTVDLNDRKVFGIGLGRYNFLGLYEDIRTNSLFAGFRRAYSQSLPGFPVNDLNNTANRVRTRTYVGTRLTPAGARVQPYFTADYSPIDRNGVRDVWYPNTSPRDIDDTRKSRVLAVQASFWPTRKDYDRLILTAGFRKDKQTSQRKEYVASQGVYQGANWRGSPWEMSAETRAAVWDGARNFGTLGPVSTSEAPTKSYSAIFKLTKDFGLFYNFSDVSIAASSLFTDIYDRFVEDTVGETNDFGLRVNLLGGRLVTSLTVFETVARNQRESDIRTRFTPALEDIWTVVDPAGQIHKGFNERYVTLRSDTSDGFEFSLVANLARGWSSRLSVSRINTIIEDRLPIVDQYIAEFKPLWETRRQSPLAPTDQVAPSYLTVGNALDRVYGVIADLHALEGTVPSAQREYKVVFNTNYTFGDGLLKGVGIGVGFRWEDSDIIGYAVGSTFVVDGSRPFFGEELLDASGTLSYSTRIWRKPVRLQLNVNNLLGKEGTFPRSAIDDLRGNPSYGRQQVIEPRSFGLTATLDL
jgi:iron complex outermembrane recepter protein